MNVWMLACLPAEWHGRGEMTVKKYEIRKNTTKTLLKGGVLECWSNMDG